MYSTPSISEAFGIGGGWMWIIVLWGLVFYGFLVVQALKRREANFIPLLWGLLFSLFLLGPLGSAVGICQAGYALESAAPEARMKAMSFGLAISMYTTIFSSILSVIGATLLGIVSYKTKR